MGNSAETSGLPANEGGWSANDGEGNRHVDVG
jgi:hypothetical protein